MFGLSFTHLVLLAIIVLVFIGPEQLPEVARTFARLLNDWKRASSEIQSSLTSTLKDDFHKKDVMIDPKTVGLPPVPEPPKTPPHDPGDGKV